MVRERTILRTTVDQLMEFVKTKEKVSLEDVSKLLKIPIKTVHALVDFLVEEKILGIEYKFTTPYIYLSKKDFQVPPFDKKKEANALLSKEEFYEKAKLRKILYQNIEPLWNKYLETQLQGLKKEFFKKSRQKNIAENKTEQLWQKYLSHL